MEKVGSYLQPVGAIYVIVRIDYVKLMGFIAKSMFEKFHRNLHKKLWEMRKLVAA